MRTADGGPLLCFRFSDEEKMAYKFERLEVWQRALEYADLIYAVADALPRSEDFNLKSQITRAANSIALDIAEGSTSQTDAEQVRFIGIALRSLIETVACLHLIKRRGYLEDPAPLREAYHFSESLFAQLQAFRKALQGSPQFRETPMHYEVDTPAPI